MYFMIGKYDKEFSTLETFPASCPLYYELIVAVKADFNNSNEAASAPLHALILI